MSDFTFSTENIPLEIPFFVPFSKSMSNRLLVITHLKARLGETVPVTHLSKCYDTAIIHHHLATLERETEATLDCYNSGTAFRFLMAVCAVTKGRWTLTANLRMKSRQTEPLIHILNQLGGRLSIVSNPYQFEVIVEGVEQLCCQQGMLHLPVQSSSQTISALLLIQDFIHAFDLTYLPSQPSIAYIKMTESLIANPYQSMEKDWSSAAFAYCLMAVRKQGVVNIGRLFPSTLQPDAAAEDLFANYGVHTKHTDWGLRLIYRRTYVSKEDIIIDISQCPDLYLPLLVASSGFNFKTTFVGMESLRYKESSRQLFAQILQDVNPDTPFITTDSDHRAAMAFSMLAFRYGSVTIDDKDCVKKSFFSFWQNFKM